MKKSNITLTILMLILPVSILISHFTLLAEFRKGNFTKVPMMEREYTIKDLPEFRYLSIDGKVKMEARMPEGITAQVKPVRVSVGVYRQSSIEIDKYMQEYVRTRVSGDTLYLWFEAKYPSEWGRNTSTHGIIIYSCALDGMYAADANLAIDVWQQTRPSSIALIRTSSISMTNVRMPRMDLKLEQAQLYLGDQEIDTLNYSLRKNGFLNLQLAQRVKVFHADGIDKSANVLQPVSSQPSR